MNIQPAQTPEARNILLTIQYEGTRYCGWQRQENALSVQQVVEEALAPVSGAPVRLTAAGRTDAGVHAAGQMANFHTHSPHPLEAFVRAGNQRLPADVALLQAREVPPGFSARRDARLRWYRYRIHCGPARPVFGREQLLHCRYRLNEGRARRALEMLRGRHEFSAFRSAECTATRTVLDLQDAELEIAGPLWTLDFRCRSFLHNMVRIMTGAVIGVARGGVTLDDLRAALENGRRSARIATAPARGLTLMAVGYPPGRLRGPDRGR